MIMYRPMFWLAFSITLAENCLAQPTRPNPAYSYQVVRLSEHDTLNVRQQPDVESPIIEKLVSTARNVRVTGRRSRTETAEWWEIILANVEQSTGWINRHYLSATPDQENLDNFPISCSGTEPFWSLKIDAGKAKYLSPDSETYSLFDACPWIYARGTPSHFVIKLDADKSSSQPSGIVAITDADNQCSDHMSEHEYPFYSTVILPNGDVYGGCCARAR